MAASVFPNSRKQQAFETKQRIFNSALSLFEELGYDNVQISQICQRANVSVGLFYNYFDNKADVLSEAFLNAGKDEYLNIYNEYLIKTRGVAKILLFIRHTSILHLDMNKDSLRLHYANLLLDPKRGQTILNGKRTIYQIIHEGLLEAQEDGDISRNSDLAELMAKIILIIRGFVFDYLLNSDQTPRPSVETPVSICASLLNQERPVSKDIRNT